MSQEEKTPFPEPIVGVPFVERWCEMCKKMKSVADFEKPVDPHSECDECKATYNSSWKRKLRIKQDLAQKMVNSLRGNEIKAPHISELCDVMIEKLGGLGEFATFYAEQIQFAAEDKPGGKAVLDACRSVTALIELSTKHRGSAPDMADLTDRDIAVALGKLMAEQGLLEFDADEDDDVLKLEDRSG